MSPSGRLQRTKKNRELTVDLREIDIRIGWCTKSKDEKSARQCVHNPLTIMRISVSFPLPCCRHVFFSLLFLCTLATNVYERYDDI